MRTRLNQAASRLKKSRVGLRVGTETLSRAGKTRMMDQTEAVSPPRLPQTQKARRPPLPEQCKMGVQLRDLRLSTDHERGGLARQGRRKEGSPLESSICPGPRTRELRRICPSTSVTIRRSLSARPERLARDQRMQDKHRHTQVRATSSARSSCKMESCASAPPLSLRRTIA